MARLARRHPSNFRNMARVWEKEHDHYEAEKKKADAKAEFEAEQAFLQTLSMLRWVRGDRRAGLGPAVLLRGAFMCWHESLMLLTVTLLNLPACSPEEQEKYRQRQSVSFL